MGRRPVVRFEEELLKRLRPAADTDCVTGSGGRPPEFFETAVESSAVAFAVVGSDGTLAYHTPAAGMTMRAPGAQLIGETFAALFTPQTRGNVEAYLRRLAADRDGRVLSVEASLTLTDGHERWVRVDGVNLLATESVRGCVLTLADMTDMRRELAELISDLEVDRLTCVGNRRALQRHLECVESASVLMLDLDNFKAINDTYGHVGGDELLKTVAGRLERAVGAAGAVYRAGGDEFVVVLPHAAVETAWALAQAALRSLSAPIGDQGVHVTASVGIAHPDTGSAGDILIRADRALYRAKVTERGTIVVDEPEGEDRAGRRRTALETARHREAGLRAEIARLIEVNRHDERTGLLNAAAYASDILGIDALARQEGTGYAIALCDIDYFGAYNKRYLFEPANLVLRRVADALRAVCRPGDLVYRWGGEELVVVLPHTQLADAASLGERLRAAVEALDIPHDGRPAPQRVTISVGVAALHPAHHRTAGEVFAEANAQLVAAKHAGRNLVVPSAPER